MSGLGAVDCLKHIIPNGMGSLPVWCLDISVHTLGTVRRETDTGFDDGRHQRCNTICPCSRLMPSYAFLCLSLFFLFFLFFLFVLFFLSFLSLLMSSAKAQSAQWSVESWKLHHGKQQSNKTCVILATLTMGSSKLNTIVSPSKTGKNASSHCTEPSTLEDHWTGKACGAILSILKGVCTPTLQMVVTLRCKKKKRFQ